MRIGGAIGIRGTAECGGNILRGKEQCVDEGGSQEIEPW